RRARIRTEFGAVPAYAVARAGVPVDVAPPERKRRRGRLTAPEEPERAVSREEFDEMVRDLHADPRPSRAATAEPEPEPEPEPDTAADLAPEDLVLKDDKKPRVKQRRPRN